MRHTFRVVIAIIAMQKGHMVGMHVKAIENEGRPKADDNPSLMAALVDAIGNQCLHQVARAKA